MSEILGSSLKEVQNKVISNREVLFDHLRSLDKRGIKWFDYDSRKEEMIKNGAQDKVLNINIGGRHFQTTLLTVLNNPDTLFFNLILSNQWNITEELFIDRSYRHFSKILSYMRFKEVYLGNHEDEEIMEITKEADFYQINAMKDYMDNYCREITYVSFEFSGAYISGNQTAGTNNIEDLNNFDDRSCMKGICTAYTGWILLELSKEVEFEDIEIGGYRGNTGLYSSSNGSGASIQTSLDKTTWTTVGTINSSYGNQVYMHKVTPSRAKYLKFNHNSYLGIGYCRIYKLKK